MQNQTALDAGFPPEVLAEIFCHCIPRTPKHPSPDRAPLLLLRICSTWRKIALEHPQLWSELSLNSGHAAPATVSELINLVNVWFERAGQLPLSLSIDIATSHVSEFWFDQQLTDDFFVKAVNPYVNRYRHLSLRGETMSPFSTFLSMPSGGVDLLESLKWQIITPFQGDLDRLSVFKSAPRLRRVDFGVEGHSITDVPLPWAQLTHLIVERTFLDLLAWRSLLHHCPQLRSGAFFIAVTEAPHIEDVTAHTIANLTELKIVMDGYGDDDPTFFHRLSFPALTTFQLSGGYDKFPVNLDHPELNLHVLRKLVVASMDMPWEELVAFLRKTPALTELKVDLNFPQETDYDSFFTALTFTDEESHNVVPLLQKLDIYALIDEDFAASKFVAMVRSRQNPDVRESTVARMYVSLRIECTEEFEDTNYWMGSLEKERVGHGIDFTVTEVRGMDRLSFEEDDLDTWARSLN